MAKIANEGVAQLGTATVKFNDISLEGHGLSNCRSNIDPESESFKELLGDIRMRGLTTPPVVWDVEGTEGGPVVVLAGHRRYKAIQIIRQEFVNDFQTKNGKAPEEGEIPFSDLEVAIFEGNLLDAMTANLTDNVRHEDVTVFDQIRHISDLHNMYVQAAQESESNRRHTQGMTAKMLQISQSKVSQYVRIAAVAAPELMEALRTEKITYAQIRDLTGSAFREKLADGTEVGLHDKQREELQKLLTDDSHQIDKGKPKTTERRVKSFLSKTDAATLIQVLLEAEARVKEALDANTEAPVSEERLAFIRETIGFLHLSKAPGADEDRVMANVKAFVYGTNTQGFNDTLDALQAAAAEKKAAKGKKKAATAAKTAEAAPEAEAKPAAKKKRRKTTPAATTAAE